MDPLSGCWPHWEKQLAAARREGMIAGLERALEFVPRFTSTHQAIRAEIERLKREQR